MILSIKIIRDVRIQTMPIQNKVNKIKKKLEQKLSLAKIILSAFEEPKCVEKSNSCVYIEIATGLWKTASCGDLESFGCEFDPGTIIHSTPRPTESECFIEKILISYKLFG